MLIVASGLVSGCALPTSPVSVAPRKEGVGSMAAMAGGAVAGAAIGHEVGGDDGALIGAGAGAVVGGLVNRSVTAWHRKSLAEAKEEGRREAALEAQERAWTAATQQAQMNAAGERRGAASNAIEYPAGTYDGVNYGPRTIPAPTPRN